MAHSDLTLDREPWRTARGPRARARWCRCSMARARRPTSARRAGRAHRGMARCTTSPQAQQRCSGTEFLRSLLAPRHDQLASTHDAAGGRELRALQRRRRGPGCSTAGTPQARLQSSNCLTEAACTREGVKEGTGRRKEPFQLPATLCIKQSSRQAKVHLQVERGWAAAMRTRPPRRSMTRSGPRIMRGMAPNHMGTGAVDESVS